MKKNTFNQLQGGHNAMRKTKVLKAVAISAILAGSVFYITPASADTILYNGKELCGPALMDTYYEDSPLKLSDSDLNGTKSLTPSTLQYDAFKSTYKDVGNWSNQIRFEQGETSKAFSFKLTKSSFVSVNIKAELYKLPQSKKCNAYLAVKTSDGYTQVSGTSRISVPNSTENNGEKAINTTAYLSPGDYYIIFDRTTAVSDTEGNVYADVKISNLSTESAQSQTTISYNNVQKAYSLTSGKTTESFFSNTESKKYYKFTVKTDSTVDLKFARYSPFSDEVLQTFNCSLYQKNGTYYENTGKTFTLHANNNEQNETLNLNKGSYIMVIDGSRNGTPILRGALNVTYTATEYNLTAPKKPVIKSYTCGGTQISGKCDTVNAKIHVACKKSGSSSVTITTDTNATVSSSKNWTVTLKKPLNAGDTITIYAENPNGMLNTDSATKKICKYLCTESDPVLVQGNTNLKTPVLNDHTVSALTLNQASLTLKGKKLSGVAVNLTINPDKANEKKFATGYTNSTTWSLKVSSGSVGGYLTPGTIMELQSIDKYGNTSNKVRFYVPNEAKVTDAKIGGNKITGTCQRTAVSEVYVSVNKGKTFTKAKLSGSKFLLTLNKKLSKNDRIVTYVVTKKPARPGKLYEAIQIKSTKSASYIPTEKKKN